MEKTKELLKSIDIKILEVAEKVGYDNHLRQERTLCFRAGIFTLSTVKRLIHPRGGYILGWDLFEDTPK